MVVCEATKKEGKNNHAPNCKLKTMITADKVYTSAVPVALSLDMMSSIDHHRSNPPPTLVEESAAYDHGLVSWNY